MNKVYSIHCERGVAEIENFAEIFHIAFEVLGGGDPARIVANISWVLLLVLSVIRHERFCL